jgi:hypothetical protein
MRVGSEPLGVDPRHQHFFKAPQEPVLCRQCRRNSILQFIQAWVSSWPCHYGLINLEWITSAFWILVSSSLKGLVKDVHEWIQVKCGAWQGKCLMNVPLKPLAQKSSAPNGGLRKKINSSYRYLSRFYVLLTFFFSVLGLELKGLHLEPLHQPYFVCVCVCVWRVFWDRVSRNYLPRLASNHNPFDLCLLNKLGLQVWATSAWLYC